VVDDAIRFVSQKSARKMRSTSDNIGESVKESKESDYNEDGNHLDEQEEEASEITGTTTTEI
jgi:hypothetical protein